MEENLGEMKLWQCTIQRISLLRETTLAKSQVVWTSFVYEVYVSIDTV